MNNSIQDLQPHCAYFRVYFEDTDMMGIVYHARHLQFFERARTELLRYNGFNLTSMSTYGTHFAIRDVNLRYIYPAKLDDLIRIQTCIAGVKACSLLFDQSMYNQADKLLCTATIEVVCVDKNLKPKRIRSLKSDV